MPENSFITSSLVRRRVTPWPKSRFSLFNWKRVKRGNEFIVLMLDSWNGDSFLNYAKQKVIIKAIHANQRFETDDVTKLVSFPFFLAEEWKVIKFQFIDLCCSILFNWAARSFVWHSCFDGSGEAKLKEERTLLSPMPGTLRFLAFLDIKHEHCASEMQSR